MASRRETGRRWCCEREGGAAPFVAPCRGASGVLSRRCSPTMTRLARPRGALLGLEERRRHEPSHRLTPTGSSSSVPRVNGCAARRSERCGARRSRAPELRVSSSTSSGTTTPRSWVDESVGTPGSVPRGRYQPRSDGHPSRPAIADQFQRPTRRLGRAVLERLLSGLAPGGVYLAVSVT